MRTYVYIDGFNLYYGALKDSPYKWLNPLALCSNLLPPNDIVKIKYFTATVSARPHDPQQPVRQQVYLRALQTIDDLEIFYGHFLTNTRRMPLAYPPRRGPRTVQVLRTEEKGSDVNLATHLLHDGHRGDYEVAVLITNDSDLIEPIRLVREDIGLRVGVLNPHRKPAHELAKCATFIKSIRKGVLASSQFPDTLVDGSGTIHKPSSW